MNRQKRSLKNTNPEPILKKNIQCWKSSRALVSKTIPLELDLENREIYVSDESLAMHPIHISSKNLDSFISQYVDPEQCMQVRELLSEAGRGIEKPISFCFVHPQLHKKFCFEYRYTITYVSYAKTRLKGELVSLRDNRCAEKAPRSAEHDNSHNDH